MDKILLKALKKYGIQQQSMVAVEELAELQKEISKATRGTLNKKHLTEEIADVYIMIEQLKMYYKISDTDVQNIVNQKIQRLNKKLNNEIDVIDTKCIDCQNELSIIKAEVIIKNTKPYQVLYYGCTNKKCNQYHRFVYAKYINLADHSDVFKIKLQTN